MEITKLTCCNCGAAQLRDDGAGKYTCEYCGATYLIELDRRTGELRDAKVSGNGQHSWQVYAVHGKLKISGNGNTVNIRQTAPDAVHVRNLKVSGNKNSADVVLLDGAEVKVSGNFNKVCRI